MITQHLTGNRPWRRKRLLTAALIASAGAFIGGASADRATAEPGRSDPEVSLVANLSERKLVIREGSADVEAFPISVGRGSKPTPRGAYLIRKIVWNPAWIPPDEEWAKDKRPQPPGAKDNPMKLVKIFFKEPDYYIHGTSEVESLGEAASHGCLRMHPDDAYRVARYLMEHGGQPRDESWFWRVLHFRSQTKTVYLDHPIPLAVTG
jgi:lipoprotein-anchoring transpeptidase ErfK/SrfK